MGEKKETGVDSESHEKHIQKHRQKPTEKIENYIRLNYVAQSVTSVLGMVTFNKDSCN